MRTPWSSPYEAVAIVVLLAVTQVVGAVTLVGRADNATTAANATSTPPPPYLLASANRGATFYSRGRWDFWSYPDPTHGSVDYLSKSDAQAQGLIGITANGTAYARASTVDLPPGQFRPSVRFESRAKYDHAVVLFDVVAMPVGCATWPALWTQDGATWPFNGEIDVMEQVGYYAGGGNANSYSVHMGDDAVNVANTTSFVGTSTATQCNTAYALQQNGCSIRDSNTRGASWGPAFNAAGGGVWAVQFGGGNGVKIWFWGRSRVPTQLSNATYSPPSLDPASWGRPMASFQSPTIDAKLRRQSIVLDLTIGGDWAGNRPMDGPCANLTFADALQRGSNYADAQFVLNAIDVYTPEGSSNAASSLGRHSPIGRLLKHARRQRRQGRW